MAHYVHRPAPRFDFGGSGFLTRIAAPSDSCWKKYKNVELQKEQIRVPNSAGPHELGWVIIQKKREPVVMFSLYQKSMDGFVPVQTKFMPARPTFSILNEMCDLFGSGTKNMSAPMTDLTFDMPGYKDFQEAMNDSTAFMIDEMMGWFKGSEHFGAVMAHVYLAVSGDVMNWLAKAQTGPSAPHPGQPGN